ncbi:MAG: AAA family ATPase [Candidatus Methanoperedens sp.]
MEIIKEVKISNYKGLEDIQFPCGSINIIVGPNNTGKSSILESILMSISSLNSFEDALEIELSDILDLDDVNIKYFILQGKKKSTVEVEIFDNNIITLDILYEERGYPQEVASDFLNFINRASTQSTLDSIYHRDPRKRVRSPIYDLSREIRFLESTLEKEESRNIDSKKEEIKRMLKLMSERLESAIEEYRNELIKSEKLFLVSKLNHNLIAMHVTMDEYIGEIPVLFEKSSYNIPLIISSPKINYDISTLYKKLVNTKKLQDVLEILKNRIPYFEDIREVNGEMVVLLGDRTESLPLSFMGDGLKALLKLSFMAPLVKNGIVLFDEPEASMHLGYLNILAKEILLNSSDTQFFISTHSLELLNKILESADKSDKLESVRILRLRRLSDGFIERETLSGGEAKEEIESIETDLRGF